MPRATPKPTIEEIDATIEAIRARAEKEIAALEQRTTRVQASHFQRIVVNNKKVRGWDLPPNHFGGQTLTDVWLDE